MDGNAEVRRLFSICIKELPEDTPATRRQAPRTASVIFMMFFLYPNSRSDGRIRPSVEPSSTMKNVARHSRPRTITSAMNQPQQKSPAAAEPRFSILDAMSLL
jgi:hypothetical protein